MELEAAEIMLDQGFIPISDNPLISLYMRKRNLFQSIDIAVTNNSVKAIQHLWKQDLTDTEKNYLLEQATIYGRKEIVRFLYKKGVRNFDEALLLAVQFNHKKLVKYFVKRGAKTKAEAYYLAVQLGNKDLLKYLK